MALKTRRNRKNGGGWAQGPPLSNEQYYLSEYKAYTDCYPMTRPGSIQSNPNPELAQTPMAGGKSRTRKNRKVGGSSCREYFLTRGQTGGCGCMMRGGQYGECPYKSESFNCPYKQGGSKNKKKNYKRFSLKGGRYTVDTAASIGGDGPNVAPTYSHFPCEAQRPMPINPHQPTELVSAPESGIHFAGLSPGAVLKGGYKKQVKKTNKSKKVKRYQGGEHPLAYTAPRAGFSFFPNIAHGQTLNPGQIPYEVVVPTNGSNSASCGSTCGDAMKEINKA